MAVVSMSKQEFTRLDVLLRVRSGRLHIAGSRECRLSTGSRKQGIFRGGQNAQLRGHGAIQVAWRFWQHCLQLGGIVHVRRGHVDTVGTGQADWGPNDCRMPAAATSLETDE
jgi:hypothetical protein